MNFKLKKIGKAAIAAVTNPKNFINPLFSLSEMDKEIGKINDQEKQEEKTRLETMQQAEIDASNQAFQADLEKKRRASKRSNVVFAGALGGGNGVGLGGQKKLLGL